MPWALLAPALPLLAVNVGLWIVFDLAHHLPLVLALLGPAFLWLSWSARRLELARASGRAFAAAVLAGALLLRLPMLPLPLTLSDDALRYLWDGKVAAAGYNPYALTPQAEALTLLRDEAWQRVPHPQVPTVYPPLSIAAFSIAARLPNPILAWKALVTAADLLGCWLLLGLARRLSIPPQRTVWYAWNPLVALEVAGMGHVDALGVAAALGAVFCLTGLARRQPLATDEKCVPAASPRDACAARGIWAAATWMAAGVLAKLLPLAALLMWSRQSRRPARVLIAVLVMAAAAGLPVVVATGGLPRGLVTYAVSWEFNGPLFEPLWRLLDAAGAAPAAARLLDAAKRASGEYTLFNPLYPFLYPQLMAKVLLGAGMVAAVAASLGQVRPARGTGKLFAWLLLLSATVYPWYLLWVLPWAALYRHTAWLALSGLILLSYLPQATGLHLMPWVFLAIWAPFGVLSLAGRRWSSA
ncbi:MAG TPA: hypothetical protein VHQ90_22305 [Thermoanaerobaculia bacterium]|nr:hypothetical protein [Thermoanaerobaculia bacterium]